MPSNWWETTFPQGQQSLIIPDATGREVKIAYGEKGTGQPLLLVHGIGSWSYSWRHLIDPLAQSFRVICVDLKGNGFSDKPQQIEPIGHEIIELQRVIRALCDQPVILIAQSLGALISLGLVEEYPQLCEKMVLINVPIFLDTLPSWWMPAIARLPFSLIQWFDQARLSKPLAPLIREITRFSRRELVTDPSLITLEDVYWITYPYIEFPGAIAQYGQALQQACREIESLVQQKPNTIRNIQAKLPQITQPTLLLWGDQDHWFPLPQGKTLQQALPNAQLQILPNCGHDAAASCPQPILEALTPFLPLP
ncbi:alpha/beta hydrolase [Spirulina subsalsa FACHB-351]|uniref:Alpha/beta hydrolase n=1 Tax=Spirulina subsalsa FACHB-351 TaxID=234711 RepID=A0ABT3L0S3_9CYAN|nr:alpha/beta hydrolase [Spirulina subsalsa]MCW6035099.1 alpha/beta hydrolase [Spirulina subsalsa FACHB-351]